MTRPWKWHCSPAESRLLWWTVKDPTWGHYVKHVTLWDLKISLLQKHIAALGLASLLPPYDCLCLCVPRIHLDLDLIPSVRVRLLGGQDFFKLLLGDAAVV